MLKETKFYFALTVIGVCVAFLVWGLVLQQSDRRPDREGGSFVMLISIMPIIPLIFYAKNNNPNK